MRRISAILSCLGACSAQPQARDPGSTQVVVVAAPAPSPALDAGARDSQPEAQAEQVPEASVASQAADAQAEPSPARAAPVGTYDTCLGTCKASMDQCMRENPSNTKRCADGIHRCSQRCQRDFPGEGDDNPF